MFENDYRKEASCFYWKQQDFSMFPSSLSFYSPPSEFIDLKYVFNNFNNNDTNFKDYLESKNR